MYGKIENIAPIFIGTLNRADHFKRAIDSLRDNGLAGMTHLFVGLDYPSKDEHWDGYLQIQQYLDSLTGFRDLTLIKRDCHNGAVRNFQTGQDYVLQYYDRIIITEDDNYYSRNFLEFMNIGLDKFYPEQRVFGICGHTYPISFSDRYQGNYFAWQGASVWGFGIWRNRYETLNYKKSDIRIFLKSPCNVYRAQRIASHYNLSWLSQLRSTNFDPYSDSVINLHLLKTHSFCIFPTVSKVRNFGHDGSGVRCGQIEGNSPFVTQDIDHSVFFEYVCNEKVLFDNPLIQRMLFKYFYRGTIPNVRTFIALVKFYLHPEISNRI